MNAIDKMIHLDNNAGEAWAYISDDGRTLEIYVRPLDAFGNNVLERPCIVKLPLQKFRRIADALE